jgi:hypothetical protein
MRRIKEPYFTIAWFNSVCPETGKAIRTGDRILYDPGAKKAYHAESEYAGEIRARIADRNLGLADAEW